MIKLLLLSMSFSMAQSGTNILRERPIHYPSNLQHSDCVKDFEHLKEVRDQHLRSGFLQSSPNILVLLVDFEDEPREVDKAEIEELFNVRTIESHPNSGGFKDYYSKNSYGQFEPNSIIAGWYRAKHSYSHYANVIGSSQSRDSLYYEGMAAAFADPDIDLKQFDNDGDGVAEGVILLTSRAIGAQARFFKDVVYDGIEFPSFAISFITGNETRLGTTAHEYGHILGLPDLYLTNEPVGLYCIMSHAKGAIPGNFSAWSKVKLGWIDPVVVEEAGTSLEIPESNSRPFAAKIYSDIYRDGRYFLLENRVQEGYDAPGAGKIQGDGLLIYHVDESFANEWVRVMQADGDNDLGKWNLSNGQEGNVGDEGDFFPGPNNNRLFDASSNPNSLSFFEEDWGVVVRNISDAGPVMKVDIDPIQRKGGTLRIDEDLLNIFAEPAYSKTPFAGTTNDSVWGGDVYNSNGFKQIEGFTYHFSGFYTLPDDQFDAQKVNLRLYRSFDPVTGTPTDLFYSGRFDVELPALPAGFPPGSYFINGRAIVWLDEPVEVPETFFGIYCPIKDMDDPLEKNQILTGLSSISRNLPDDYGSYYAFGADFPRFAKNRGKFYTLHFYVSDGKQSTSISPSADEVRLSLYPNPTQDLVTILNGASKKLELRLINPMGQELRRISARPGTTEVSLEGYAKGTYYFIGSDEQQKILINKKLILIE